MQPITEPLHIAIPHKLSQTTESSFFQGSLELEPFTQGTDVYVFDGPVTYSFTLTNTSGALLALGSVEAKAHTACARCLEDASVDIAGEIEGYFLLPGQDGNDIPDGEREEYVVLDDPTRLDVAPLISAAISTALPLVPLCEEDCKGLCPNCGANLNEGPCSCKDEPDDMNPFAVLKTIMFD